MTNETRGRRILIALGVVIVGICAGVGFLVGAHASERTAAIELVGPASLPATPIAFALYGGAVAAAVLGGLFGAVSLASRFDSA